MKVIRSCILLRIQHHRRFFLYVVFSIVLTLDFMVMLMKWF